MQPCAFIDRDGVLIEDRGYVYRPEEMQLLPGVVAALKLLRTKGYLLICVTNQSGVARGMFTLADVDKFHAHLTAELQKQGAALDAIYTCPHHPDGKIAEYSLKCDCRKPLPGLIQRANRDFAIDMARSFLAGDKDSDIACARNAGIMSVRISSGQYGANLPADVTGRSLLEATERYLSVKAES